MGIKSFLSQPPLFEPGLHHFSLEDDGYRTRVHLRIDPDGHGTLLINANRVVHFNPTAALMAYLVLKNTTENAAIRAIRRQFKVPKSQARDDYAKFKADLSQIIHPDSCPVCAIEDL